MMADFSAVSLTIKLADANKLRKKKFFQIMELEPDSSSIDDDGMETFEFQTARYGMEELSEALSWLRYYNMEYTAIDNGGYDWDAYQVGWRIGMEGGHWRGLDYDGSPVLSQAQWELATSRTSTAWGVIGQVADHFGDNPVHWLGGQYANVE